MEIAKFIVIGQELLKLLSENDVRIGDWKYVKLYEEYRNMRNNGSWQWESTALSWNMSHTTIPVPCTLL